MNCGHLFNGVGGFALAAHWMNWNNVMHCEIDPFCNKVMNYHFPNSYQHEDIRTTDFTIWRGKLDLITGGFPCQPYSTAGKRKGKEDDRHLWPEMLRAIREIQPGWIVGENVRGLTSWNGGLVFDEVQADLEAEGYEVLPFLLPACGVNAPHRRDRIWFVAHAIGNGHQRANGFGKDRCEKGETEGAEQREERNELQREWFWPNIGGDVAERVTTNTESIGRDNGSTENERSTAGEKHTPGNKAKICVQQFTANSNCGQRCEGGLHAEGSEATTGHACSCDTRYDRADWQDFPTQPPVCNRNDGLSGELADWPVPSKSATRILTGKQSYGRWRKESIKAMGNAVVPQVVFQIFKAIEQYEQL